MSVNKEMKVLIVDDYQTMRGVIRNLFNQLGFANVVEAGSTDDALVLLKNKTGFGLIVFDWHTGPMKAEDFLKTVRLDDQIGDLPFVVVSAESNPDFVQSMKDAGASDFIAKPLTKATLQKRMASLFGSF